MKKNLAAHAALVCAMVFANPQSFAEASSDEEYLTEVGPAGGKGGSQFYQQCDLEGVSGLDLRVGSYVDAIKPVCKSGRYIQKTGGGGGTIAVTNCPKDMLLVGVMGGAGLYVDSIQVVCENPNGAKRPHVGSSHGGNGGSPYTLLCPEGEYAIGLFGRSGIYIDAVGLLCEPIE